MKDSAVFGKCFDAENNSKETTEKNMDNPGVLPVAQRSVVAFWFLGLCNNYGYVVMLSAAVDIIKSTTSNVDSPINSNATLTDANPARKCTEMSTGAILLADIIPSLIIKIIAPFFPLAIHFRIALVVALNVAGFILVSQAKSIVMAIAGVVTIAFGSGLGETSLLAYMAFYKNRRVLSGWSSGTGAAGLCGASSYMLLTYLAGNNRAEPLLVFLVVPVIMAVAFWIALERPVLTSLPGRSYDDNINDVCQAVHSTEVIDDSSELFRPTLMDKVKAVPGLLKYMLPFGLVYLFEYFINQGLQELIHFNYNWITPDHQYVSYQLLYQAGVFFSRSSIGFFRVHQTWLLAFLQGINVIILGADAVYGYIPAVYYVWALILWEGCLGGLSYVNTYDRISHEVPVERREFSMSINSFGDAVGISVAGILAIPAHNFICSLPIYR